MALAIRLSRGGRKALPFYRIVVADKRMARDGRYIEKLGTYNPLLQDNNDQRVVLVKERIEYWLKQGAEPSERVAMFLGKAGMIEMPKQTVRPTKSAQSEKTKLRIAEKAEKQKAAVEAAAQAKIDAAAAAEQAKADAKAAEEAAKAEAEAAANAPAPAEEPAAAEAEAPAEEPKAE